jgi:hypothetical protein
MGNRPGWESPLLGDLDAQASIWALEVFQAILISGRQWLFSKNRTLCSLAYLRNRCGWGNLPKEKGLASLLGWKGLSSDFARPPS